MSPLKSMVERLSTFFGPEITVTEETGQYCLYSGYPWAQVEIQLLFVKREIGYCHLFLKINFYSLEVGIETRAAFKSFSFVLNFWSSKL